MKESLTPRSEILGVMLSAKLYPQITVAITMALVVGVIAGVLLWRNSPSPWITTDARMQARNNARLYAAAPRVPITNTEAVRSVVVSASMIPDQIRLAETTSDQRELLARTITDWLNLYHVGDADAYVAWMRSRGWSLVLDRHDADSFPNLARSNMDSAYRFFTGAPAPEGITGDIYFRFIWDHYMPHLGGWIRPSESVTDPSLVAAVYRRLSTPDSTTLEDWAGMERWFGQKDLPCVQHWAPPTLLGEVIQRDGDALVATVLLPIRTRTGHWMTIIFSAFWEPVRAIWDFDMIWSSNFTEVHLEFVL